VAAVSRRDFSQTRQMPYNHGMAHITLVLPFALPAPEFAPELARALDAPALAALLSRTSSYSLTPADAAVRALPHEVWLARALALESGGQPAFAAAAMRGYRLDPGAGTWFIVNPSHIEIARSHLLMADLRRLALSEEHGRALFASAKPAFAEAGHELEYGDAQTWFMRADDWSAMDTASPDAAVGMNLMDWMPSGPRAIAYRKLQNEVQMVWYTDPVNAAREAGGLPPVNAFWLWSGTPATPSTSADRVAPAHGPARARAAHAERQNAKNGTPTVATFDTPSWLTALAARELPTLGESTTDITNDTLLVCGNVAAASIASDWSGWLQQMQRLEAELFAPLLAALMRGEIKHIRLVLSNRGAHAEFTTTAMAQRKFWRRPTLDRLI
jgi:hypothetical protein